MLEPLIKLLQTSPLIGGFKVVEEVIHAQEFFLVKQELDMNRAKSVQKIALTVYKDLEVGGVKYKGEARVKLHPTMNQRELEQAIAEAAYAANLVRNREYPLVKPNPKPLATGLSNQPSLPWEAVLKNVPDLIVALQEAGRGMAGWLNSAELFITRIQKRVVNSEGVDGSEVLLDSKLELVVTSPGAQEEVELYRELHCAVFTPELIAQKTRELFQLCQEKGAALPTPALGKHPVLLTGEPVRKILNYFYYQTGAEAVYEEVSTLKPGQSAQGEGIKGERLNLSLDPGFANSPYASGFDADGTWLQPVEIIKDGVVLQYWGDQQHSCYLGIPATGVIRNTIFGCGSKTVDQLKSSPYLELLAFSDFELNPVTGDFGGEIRLGRYYDGHRITPVSGGSISGNMRTVQGEMQFSREQQSLADFRGPLTIRLEQVNIAGKA